MDIDNFFFFLRTGILYCTVSTNGLQTSKTLLTQVICFFELLLSSSALFNFESFYLNRICVYQQRTAFARKCDQRPQ